MLLAIYLLLFPRGTGEEIQLQVRWIASVAEGASPPATGAQVSEGRASETPESEGGSRDRRRWAFRLGDRFGYLGDSGTVLFASDVLHHVSMTDERFVNYPDVSQTVVLHGPDGTMRSAIDAAGYPLLFEDRMLLLLPDGTTIAEWSIDGATAHRVWQYSIASVYSAIDVAGDVTLVGDIDGRLVALDGAGGELLHYRSRSGRLPVVVAVALSSDAMMAAALIDVEPQRVVVYRRDDEGYTQTAEYTLPASLRRPARMRFLLDDRFLVWEQPHALAGVRLDTDTRFELPLGAPVVDFAAVEDLGLLAVLYASEATGGDAAADAIGDTDAAADAAAADTASTGDAGDAGAAELPRPNVRSGELVLYNAVTRIPVGRLPVEARHFFLHADGDTVLLGLDDRIVAYRFIRG